MKVKLKEAQEPKEKERKYPFIGVGSASGIVVLFHTNECGMVLANPSEFREVGHARTDWAMDNFATYKGKVILSND